MPPRHKQSRKPKPHRRKTQRANPRTAQKAQIRISQRDRLAGRWFEKLVALQARLRAPAGCPWDREQTHESLRKFLIEETCEVLDAMESDDPKKFSSELGDLLLQIVFHAVLAEESGRFTISDVIESVHTKMVRRHPHVFGNVKAKTSADVLRNWEQLKSEERREESSARGARRETPDNSILDGIPRSLPAALEAYQLTRRASHIGFDWDTFSGILHKLDEEKLELRNAATAKSGNGKSPSSEMEEEAGDLLFVAVNAARFLGVDPEVALKKANRKFKERFTWMESAAAREGLRLADVPRARMEELWNESKRIGSSKVRG